MPPGWLQSLYAEKKDLLGIEAGIGALGAPNAAQKQSRSSQQHQAGGPLHREQKTALAPPAAHH